jgi:type III secretion system FlhB-like substrate exporter
VEAIRDEIVSKARKQGIPLNADRLRVSQVERSVSVQAWLAQPIFTVADETVVAVPLSLSRTFNIP